MLGQAKRSAGAAARFAALAAKPGRASKISARTTSVKYKRLFIRPREWPEW